MKLNPGKVVVMMVESRPVWGAWIEMINCIKEVLLWLLSRLVWGAWIEIVRAGEQNRRREVAPRMGRVD